MGLVGQAGKLRFWHLHAHLPGVHLATACGGHVWVVTVGEGTLTVYGLFLYFLWPGVGWVQVSRLRPCGAWRGLGSTSLARRGETSRAGVVPGRTSARAASNSEASRPTWVFWLSTALKSSACLSSALRRRSSYSRRVALRVPLMRSSTVPTSRPRISPLSGTADL